MLAPRLGQQPPPVAGVIEHSFETQLAALERRFTHLPSRVRSLVWILSSLPAMAEEGLPIALESEVRAELQARLPRQRRATADSPTVAYA